MAHTVTRVPSATATLLELVTQRDSYEELPDSGIKT